MKLIFFSLAILPLLYSCNSSQREAKNAIQYAQQNLWDSAQKSLDTLMTIANPNNLSKELYANWALYYNYSLYQLDSLPQNDSTIKIACDYYRNTNDNLKNGLSHFLHANILKTNAPDEAIDAYKIALLKLKDTKEENVMGVSAYNIGYLYFQDENYAEAIKYHRMGEKYFKAINNEYNLAFSYREIGNVMDFQKLSVDSVLYYFDKASYIFKKLKGETDYHDMQLYKATTLMYRTDSLDLAKQLMYKVYNYYDRDPYYHIRLSNLYIERNEYDSALHYFTLSELDTTNVYAKTTYYMLENRLHVMEGNYEAAHKSLKKFIDNRMKSIDETNKNQIYRIDKRFDFQEKKIENSRLRVHNRNIAIYLSLTAVVLLITTMVLMWIAFKRRKTSLTYQIEIQKLRHLHNTKREILMQTIKSRTENALVINNMGTKIQRLSPNEILNEIQGFSTIPENQWEQFISEINAVGNDFITALSSIYTNLTLSDKIVIALISLKVDITDACTLLNINKNTMYRRRNTIKERLGLDKSVDVENWIAEYMQMQSTENTN